MFFVHGVVSLIAFSHLGGQERAGCFTVFVFLVSCDDCYFSVSPPNGAVG